jgi:hypothetical protein
MIGLSFDPREDEKGTSSDRLSERFGDFLLASPGLHGQNSAAAAFDPFFRS